MTSYATPLTSARRHGVTILATLLAAITLAGCFTPGPVGNRAVPQPVQTVDLNRYLGRWYELARYEAPFQKGCEAVTADYSLRPDGLIKVVNSCRQGSISGKVKQSTGRAKVVDASNAKLKVSFFGPIWGDYWILDLAPDYSLAIIGEPSGRYLWVLSRQAHVDAVAMARIKERVIALGYDWSLVRITKQP